MSDLIIIGYPDETTAQKVWEELVSLERDYLVDLDDAAIIRRDRKGKLHITTPAHHEVTWGTFSGLFWGVLGEFKQRVQNMIRPGTSAILVILRKATLDKFVDADLGAAGGLGRNAGLSGQIAALGYLLLRRVMWPPHRRGQSRRNPKRACRKHARRVS